MTQKAGNLPKPRKPAKLRQQKKDLYGAVKSGATNSNEGGLSKRSRSSQSHRRPLLLHRQLAGGPGVDIVNKFVHKPMNIIMRIKLIKSANLKGKIKISDLEEYRPVEPTSVAETFGGTTVYMAPEGIAAAGNIR
ncbi:hypothetical protein RUND412_004885 [Rhizina undulata]